MEDNSAFISLSKNPQYHKRTKHIQTRFFWLREQVKENLVELTYCPTRNQLGYMLTKTLPGPKAREHNDNRFRVHCPKEIAIMYIR